MSALAALSAVAVAPRYGSLALEDGHDIASQLAQELGALRPPLPLVRVERGGLLRVESHGPACLHVLVRGRLRLGRLSPAGRRVELGEIESPGCLLGASAAEAVAVASKPCELRLVSPQALRRLGEVRPDLADLLLAKLEELLLDRERRLELLAYRGASERVAVALLRMRDQQGEVLTTHQALAEVVGASRETVTKLLVRLRADGAIEAGHGRLRVIDPHRLACRIG
jgi:CRP-like cAMP-binding protein